MDKERYAHSVNAQYAGSDVGSNILDRLRENNKDLNNLVYSDLSAMDQYHTRGEAASLELAEMANFKAGQKIVDVGGGMGGSARMLASEYGCIVTVVDLTEDYCRAGEMLSELTGLNDKVNFHLGSALDMPFEDASFDGAWSQHSSMNIEDKEKLYAEIARVVRPGGRLAIHEIMKGNSEPLDFPMPWAKTQDISFLIPAEEVRKLIINSGFREVSWIDVTDKTRTWAHDSSAKAAETASKAQGQAEVLMEDRFLHPRFQNLTSNLDAGKLTVIEAVFDRV